MCTLATACTQRPDDSEFIREMYEKSRYESCSFLEKLCSESLLAKLSEQYDYDGEGYDYRNQPQMDSVINMESIYTGIALL